MADSNGEPDACSVCGRSMLAGERTRTYVSRDRERHEVCALCVVRAENADWIPSELAGMQAPEQRHEGSGRMRRLIERARETSGTWSRRGHDQDPVSPQEGRAEAEAEEAEPKPSRQRRRRQPRERAGPGRRSGADGGSREHSAGTERDVAGPSASGVQVGRPAEASPRRRSVPQKPERRIRRAFETFNASPHRRTVAGLIRSLGEPYVSAVTTAETPAEVRITVAWELSWYQWEVDLAGSGVPVRELGKGSEISELSKPDQAWNARAGSDGELRLRSEGDTAAG